MFDRKTPARSGRTARENCSLLSDFPWQVVVSKFNRPLILSGSSFWETHMETTRTTVGGFDPGISLGLAGAFGRAARGDRITHKPTHQKRPGPALTPTPALREAQIPKTTLNLRLPISSPLRNPHKQGTLERHE